MNDTATLTTEIVILIAEGGGWPTHAIGPFASDEDAERFLLRDKWRESWGSLAWEARGLPVIDPEDERLVLHRSKYGWHVMDPSDPYQLQGWDEGDCLPAEKQHYEFRFATAADAEDFAKDVLGWGHGVVMDRRDDLLDVSF